jgi:hypothetical protein
MSDTARGVQERGDSSLSWSDTTGGIKEIEETRSCGPIPREVVGAQASQELEESTDLAPSRGGVDDKLMTPVKRKERSK